MDALYPLRFEPILRRYIWGGRRLGAELGKPLGEGEDYAESWEVCDHGEDQSKVVAGSLKGRTLGELVSERGKELLGIHHPQPRFPLLIKFLDAQKTLSVQVHPNDEQGAKLDPPDYGKTEAWVVMGANDGAKIYSGLKRGFDREALAREINRGTCELCLHQFEAAPGDCVFIPAGTVHALGEGLLIYEIQQSSDTTFRLFDWNRVGTDGKPRPLHIEQALDVIDYERGPVEPVKPEAGNAEGVEVLVQSDKFVLERWSFESERVLESNQRCHLLSVVQGKLSVEGDESGSPLVRGSTILIPASAESVKLTPQGDTVALVSYLP